jgi:hypothetical protein
MIMRWQRELLQNESNAILGQEIAQDEEVAAVKLKESNLTQPSVVSG